MSTTKKISLKQRMRDLEVGGKIELPIERLYTAKQYASDLKLLTGRNYTSHVNRGEKTITVTRES